MQDKKKGENLGFIIEGIERMLIQYCVLFLTTRYNQLISILVYCGYVAKKKKKKEFNIFNKAWFFGSLVIK